MGPSTGAPILMKRKEPPQIADNATSRIRLTPLMWEAFCNVSAQASQGRFQTAEADAFLFEPYVLAQTVVP